MSVGESSSGFPGSVLNSLCYSADVRARWPFLQDLQIESSDRARALTYARTDLAGWIHVPEQVRAFALLVERLLRPGENLTAISKLNFRVPLTTQARLVAERKGIKELSIPPNAASIAEFHTNHGDELSVLATPDFDHPLPAHYSASGSYVAAPSIRGFRWGSPSQTMVPIPEALLSYLQTQGDIVDTAHVLMANAACRALFTSSPALVLIVSVRDFELPDPDILVEGGSIKSIVNLAASRTTKKGFTTYEVQSNFFDQNANKDSGATFTFAATDDEALVRSFRNPRLK